MSDLYLEGDLEILFNPLEFSWWSLEQLYYSWVTLILLVCLCHIFL